MKKLLLALVLVASQAWGGTNLLDSNGNVVFTDVVSLNQSLVASGNAVTLTLRGQSSAHVQVTANTTTLQFEGSVDGVNYFAENAVAEITGALVNSTTGTGSWSIDTAGLSNIRVRQSAAGAATVSMIASQGETAVSLANALPTGANVIGALASNQSENLNQIGGAAVVTAAAGLLKVGIVGNANAVLDAPNNGTAPANVLQAGAQLQTNAQASPGTAGQLGSILAGLDHVLYARSGGPVLFQSSALTAIGATLTQVVAAPGAGLSLYVTDISLISDTATAGQFTLRFGTGSNCGTGTTTFYPSAAAVTTGKMPYPANTAAQPLFITFNQPIKLTANNALCIVCIATQTCTGDIHGYTAP